MNQKRILKIGMSGDDVKYIQKSLKSLGFHKGKTSGNFGQDTLMAIGNFQRKFNIKADGLVSIQTWAKIQESLNSK